MLLRTAKTLTCASKAWYSECEQYRYKLQRVWQPAGRRVAFIMLNPSTATELQNDPTVERCQRRAETLGYGSFWVGNIFAYRATDPKAMKAQADPVGPLNNQALKEMCAQVDDIVCAWGTHGAHGHRSTEVKRLLQEWDISPYVLKLTKGGEPSHPLYLSYEENLKKWW